MLRIVTGLDLPNASLVITVQSTLVAQYFANLNGMLVNDKDAPVGVSIEKRDHDTALISFPVTGQIIPANENGAKISIENSERVQKVINIVQRFAMSAVRHQLKNSEFLPLYDFSGGYSFEELQQDVEAAAKAKRDYIVIDTYQSYLNHTEKATYEFNQYIIPFGTSEYCDFLLLAKAGKLKELRNLYKDKLKRTSWF